MVLFRAEKTRKRLFHYTIIWVQYGLKKGYQLGNIICANLVLFRVRSFTNALSDVLSIFGVGGSLERMWGETARKQSLFEHSVFSSSKNHKWFLLCVGLLRTSTKALSDCSAYMGRGRLVWGLFIQIMIINILIVKQA